MLRTATIASSVGLHARPASLFVQAVAASGAAVTLRAGEKAVNAASILSVLSLGLAHGATVTLESDDEATLESLVGILETDMDETP